MTPPAPHTPPLLPLALLHFVSSLSTHKALGEVLNCHCLYHWKNRRNVQKSGVLLYSGDDVDVAGLTGQLGTSEGEVEAGGGGELGHGAVLLPTEELQGEDHGLLHSL